MTPIRKVAMVTTTLSIAMGIGQVMQSRSPGIQSEAASSASSPSDAAMPVKVTLLAATETGATTLPNLPDSTAALPFRPVGLSGYVLPDDGLIAVPAAKPDNGAPSCDMGLSVAATPAAMLALRVDAPCRTNARVVIRHAGLAITGRTNDLGQMQVGIPALAAQARVSVAFADGATLSAGAEVPDLADFDRVGIQWPGKAAFELHALEFGATENSRGHVSAVDPRNPAYGERGAGGFMSILGDAGVAEPLLAEVYSFPAARMTQSGTVRIYLEAAVTPDTCGRVITGKTLDLRQGSRLRMMDLSLPMPDCDALGQLLVLKNLLPDMKIARN